MRLDDERPEAEMGSEDARGRLDDALALAEALAGPPDPARLVDVCRQAVELAETLSDSVAGARSLDLLAKATSELGSFEQATQAYADAARQWSAVGIPEREVASRRGLVQTLLSSGDLRRALDESVAATRGRDWTAECAALLVAGGLRRQLGEYDEALSDLQNAERILERAEAAIRAGLCHHRAHVYLARGDTKAALAAAVEMSEAAERADDSAQRLEAIIAMALCNLRACAAVQSSTVPVP